MAFTRDFTGAPAGALKVNGPIQVAIVDETTNAGSKNYVPAVGEIILHKTSSGQVLKIGDGTTTVKNIPAITTATELANSIANAGYTTPTDVQTAMSNYDYTSAINATLASYAGINFGYVAPVA